ncbi:Gfo/Idh/MocA family oxidoreductase [Bacteroidota bacterium]
MKKIRVGMASYGMSGEIFHAPLLDVNPGFEIISILERSKNNSASRFPNSKVARSLQELLDNDMIELIIVNTPDFLHYEMTKQALLAGKHVITEKPFVMNSEMGQELIDLAKKEGLLLSVFQNRRWDGDFLTIRKILDEGLLGRLVEYEAHFDRFRNKIQTGSWKEDPDIGVGTLFNLGSHIIDQALVLFGKPEYVYADIRKLRDETQIDDSFTLLLGHTDVKITLKASYLVKEPGPRYYLHGTEGSFLKHGIDPQEDALKKGEWPGGHDWGKEAESEWGFLNTEADGKSFRGKYKTLPGNYGYFYEDILHSLKTGNEPAVTAEQANMVIRIIEAAYESNKTGKRIPI